MEDSRATASEHQRWPETRSLIVKGKRADGERFHDLAQGIAVGGRGIGPVSADRIPDVAQPLLVGIAILGNDCCHPLWERHRDAETDGRSDIESVESKSPDAQQILWMMRARLSNV